MIVCHVGSTKPGWLHTSEVSSLLGTDLKRYLRGVYRLSPFAVVHWPERFAVAVRGGYIDYVLYLDISTVSACPRKVISQPGPQVDFEATTTRSSMRTTFSQRQLVIQQGR